MDANRLARLLAKFDVHSKNVADGKQRLKGYAVQSFADAFARYLPASRASATETDNSIHDNEMQSSGKVAGTDASRYQGDKLPESSGTEPLPLPNTLPNKTLQYKELNKEVAAERLDNDPLARPDSLLGGSL
jgi:hypothetical protein